jgi:hypothetical protein
VAISSKTLNLQDKFDSVLNDKKLLLALFAGFFVLETFLSLWMGNPYDLDVWFKTGTWITHGVNIYLPLDHLGYPPLWALWCGAAYNLYLFLGANYTLWHFIIKLPIILAHLALAYVVARFAEKRFDRKKAAQIFFFILTWSFFFFVGPMWGQINVISVLLTFLAFEAVLNKKTGRGALFLGLAATLKIYPIVTLPAFLVYVLKNRGKLESAKLFIYTVAVPVVFTASIFLIYQWDVLYFFRTVLYTTPALESNPTQIAIGCMNFWSYVATLNIDMVVQWPFRMLWIPLLVGLTVYWLRKPKLDELGLTVSLLSFYIVFMATYGWVSEQSFLDLLPFTFLFILGYNPKRIYLYLLGILQGLVYAFAVTNLNLYVFEPFVWKISSPLGVALHDFYDLNGVLIWSIRNNLGLVISVALILFLVVLMKPTLFQSIPAAFGKLRRRVRDSSRLKK